MLLMLVHQPPACLPNLCIVMLFATCALTCSFALPSKWLNKFNPALPLSCTACTRPYCQHRNVCTQIDIRWINWTEPQTILPLHTFCEFRHLLHLPGCSWSARLKYLMLCRAAVVFPSSPYLEFWYRALTPGKNVLTAPEIITPDSGMELVKIAEQLKKDEPLALRYAVLLSVPIKPLLLFG